MRVCGVRMATARTYSRAVASEMIVMGTLRAVLAEFCGRNGPECGV